MSFISSLPILLFILHIFSGMRASKSANFTSTHGKVFSVAVLVIVLHFLLCLFTSAVEVGERVAQSQITKDLGETIKADYKAKLPRNNFSMPFIFFLWFISNWFGITISF